MSTRKRSSSGDDHGEILSSIPFDFGASLETRPRWPRFYPRAMRPMFRLERCCFSFAARSCAAMQCTIIVPPAHLISAHVVVVFGERIDQDALAGESVDEIASDPAFDGQFVVVGERQHPR